MPTWNDEHLAVVKEGGHVLKKWWVTHPHEPLNLDRADLSGAYLRDAMLSGANLSGTNLSRANLRDVAGPGFLCSVWLAQLCSNRLCGAGPGRWV